MADDVLSLLKKQMDEEKLTVAQSLVSGHAIDFSAYREMCGVIRGLELGQRIVGEMEQKLQKQDD